MGSLITLEVVAALLALCALTQAAMFAFNLRRYRTPRFGPVAGTHVAVCILARDEEQNIRACVQSVLASEDVSVEVIVCDGDSADRTARILWDMSLHDARVRLLRSTETPSGWNPRLFACWQMAHYTSAPIMLFLHANVRLDPWALARCVAALKAKEVKLISGFPRLKTVGWLEKLILPLIQFEMLTFLPLGRMRKTTNPRYAAGSDQFLLVDREAYLACKGHSALHDSRHDGIRLPRAFREHGFHTDVVDLTRLAEVRLYESARAVWRGLAKNATEGMAARGRILPLTFLILAGQVLPVIAAGFWVVTCSRIFTAGATFDDVATAALITMIVGAAVLASIVPRLVAASRFKQSTGSAWLHPLGVIVLLTVQWYAWTREKVGKPVGVQLREYSHETEEAA